MPIIFMIFLNLFSSSFLKYVSLSKKEVEIDIENICYYLEENDLINHNDDIKYVKPCEPGYYCHKIKSNTLEIGTCELYSPVIKKLNDKCSSTNECESNLVCINDKCLVENSTFPYYKTEYNKNIYVYCPDYLIPIQKTSVDPRNSIGCEPKQNYKIMEDKCLITTNEGTTTKAYPDYFKLCGNQTIVKSSDQYELKNTSMNYIGSIEDGLFVEDQKACKSGYALLFYGDKNITQPENDEEDNMFLMCVTVNEVQKDNSNCYIKYSIGEKSNIYNTGKISSNAKNKYSIYETIFADCEFILKKIEVFKEYITKMNEIIDTCKNERFYDEPFTCGNDVLRKLWYGYNNIENYLLYKNDNDIINYLIQEAYPLYGFEADEGKEDNSLYLNFKYFLFLLFLLSL